MPNSAAPSSSQFSTKLPIWYQLAAMLRAEILNGGRAPGSRIDTELQLAKLHGISVIPVRQALRALGDERLVVRQRGRGTFVSKDLPFAQGPTPLEVIYANEYSKPAQILERGIVATPGEFLRDFRGAPEVGYVRRLAYQGGLPWSYGALYFPACFADRIDTELLRRWPLYKIMRERFDIIIARSRFDAQATGADGDVAKAFGVDPLSPILVLASASYDAQGEAAVAFRMAFPAAPFVFSFETVHELG